MSKIDEALSLPIVERRHQGQGLPRRRDPSDKDEGEDKDQGKRSARETTRDELKQAVAKLRRARIDAVDGLDYLLASDTNDVDLVRRHPTGRVEVIRTIEAPEIIRLARLLDAGRQQLLDRKV